MASRLYLSFHPGPIQSIRATRCTSSVALMASENVSSQANSISSCITGRASPIPSLRLLGLCFLTEWALGKAPDASPRETEVGSNSAAE